LAMRDPNTGKFMKRVKEALSSSKPATLDHLLPDREVKGKNEEFMEMKDVSVDVVPTKTNVRQSTMQRSYTMSATVTVIGNLTADPELRQTNSGKSVVNFSLAYTPRKPDGSDGTTSFYNIAAWEYLADNFAASFKKGDRLIVVGRLSQDRWQDKDNPEKTMTRLVITADEIGGTCRFHTMDMQKVTKRPAVESAAGDDSELQDIFS